MTGSLSMIMLDTTVVGVALPTIQLDMAMSTAQGGWLVTSFVLTLACLLAIGGRLGDRTGRLTLFRLAVLCFLGASVWCAFATSPATLIAARILQGAAAACMQPAATAIVIGAFPQGQRGLAMATFFGISLCFLVAGPVIGGLLLEMTTWHWIFLLNVPVGISSLVLTIGLPPAPRATDARPFDPLGALLLCTGLPMMVLGLEWIVQPADFPGARWVFIPGVLVCVTFVHRALRSDAPLLDLRCFADRTLLGESLVLMLLNAVMVGQSVYGVVYLQDVLGWSPLASGLGGLALLGPILLVIGPAGRLYDRLGAAPLMRLGLPIALLGIAVEVPALHMESFPLLACGMVLLGTGTTLVTTPCNTDALSSARAGARGEVSGLIQTMRMLGASIGVVVCVGAISMWNTASTTAALSDGIAAAFAVQWILAAAALGVTVALVRTNPPTATAP